ncbi:MAG: DUF4837 family protein, partial [Bacteroidia bacterium]|nr:DUF4837 family protein [Bacteroidia bacterium]
MAKKTFRPKPLLFYVALILFFTSCLESDNIKPESSGQSGDVLLVLDESVYNSTIVDSFVLMMNTEIEGLPQFESAFDLVIIKEKDFSHLFQMHRNIITVHVDPELSETELAIKKDIWSKPQIVARMRAKDTTSLKKIVMSYTNPLIETFNNAELDRIVKNYGTIKQNEINNAMKEKFGFTASVPKTFFH